MSKLKKVKSATDHITMSRTALRALINNVYYTGHARGREAAVDEELEINYEYEIALKNVSIKSS